VDEGSAACWVWAMDALLGGRDKWTARWKRAVCAACWVGQEVGDGREKCTDKYKTGYI